MRSLSNVPEPGSKHTGNRNAICIMTPRAYEAEENVKAGLRMHQPLSPYASTRPGGKRKGRTVHATQMSSLSM